MTVRSLIVRTCNIYHSAWDSITLKCRLPHEGGRGVDRHFRTEGGRGVDRHFRTNIAKNFLRPHLVRPRRERPTGAQRLRHTVTRKHYEFKCLPWQNGTARHFTKVGYSWNAASFIALSDQRRTESLHASGVRHERDAPRHTVGPLRSEGVFIPIEKAIVFGSLTTS